MEKFYLKDIELLNFRKFDDSRYDLNPQMNIFIGKNASGKTTVLEAAAVILGAYLATYKEYVPSRFGHNISDNDVLRKSLKPVKNVAMTATIKQFPCMVSSRIVWDEKIVECKRSLEKEGGRTKFVGKKSSEGTSLRVGSNDKKCRWFG